jgi:hypothetical protein
MKNLRNRVFQASKWHATKRSKWTVSKTIHFQARFNTKFLIQFFCPSLFPITLVLIRSSRRYIKPTRYSYVTCATLTSCLLILLLIFGINAFCVRGEVSTGKIWMKREDDRISVVILIKGLTFRGYFDQNLNFIWGVIHYSSCRIWNRNTEPHR